MGNCLITVDQRVIKVMKPDGKTLEYRSPIRALELLAEFSGHSLSEATGFQALSPETELRRGSTYQLVPLARKTHVKKMKKVRFSEPEKEEKKEEEKSGKVVRIKLVISKQELKELLERGGVSVGETASQLRVERNAGSNSDGLGEGYYWKPVLESIPEV